MSNVQQASGYWQASDGQWYPPERHPNFRPPGPASGVVHAVHPPPGYGPAPGTPVPLSVQDTAETLMMEIRGSVQSGTYLSPSFNEIHAVSSKGGWIAVFAGESQEKALRRAIPVINASGQKVVAAVKDRWSIWTWIGTVLLWLITLGFVGRQPNVLLITEPTQQVSSLSALAVEG
jgi:hypothetical protein